MTDNGVIFAIRGLLKCKKKKDGDVYRGNVGAEYSPIVDAVAARMTWPGDNRTKQQNALLHKWFGEIAVQSGDITAKDVKGQCHREFGLDIRMRNPQFAWVWEQSGAALNYEQQCNLLSSGVLNLSSGMTSKELSEYMDEIEREYSRRGIRLTHPEEHE